MVETTPAILALNRGLVSPLGLARVDVKRLAMSAEVQTNIIPRVLGSAMLRPGLADVGATYGNLRARFMPGVFATTDKWLMECTNGAMRFWLPSSDNTPDTVLTRPAVTATIANGTFAGSLSSWTDADESGATSAYVAPYMSLTGTGFNRAIRYQLVTVAEPNVEHALRIQIPVHGSRVILNVGSTVGGSDYASNLTLEEGYHSIAFTPTGNFYVQFSNALTMPSYVASVAIESAGEVVLTTPWAAADLDNLRWDQSGEVVYVACDGIATQKVQRWNKRNQTGYRSFSIVYFAPMDGPFLPINTGPITITPSGTTGAITLTASAPLFQSSHVGGLWRLTSAGQSVTVAAGGTSQFSSYIEVTGLDAGGGRTMQIVVSGTFVGTVVLQRSIGAVGSWQNVSGKSWTAATSELYSDGYDNQVIYYRIGIDGTYTSGTANCQLAIEAGSITGVARVTGYTDNQHVAAVVLQLPDDTGTLHGLGNTTATSDWSEGLWSGVRGYPSGVALGEGRLWLAGGGWNVGSVSDAYESFDDTVTGDSGPIIRSIGSGPVDRINWILALQRIVLGTDGAEKSAVSSTGTAPLTPTDYNLRSAGTQGSAPIPAVAIDMNGVFVQRGGRRVYELAYKPNYFGQDYSETDLTAFIPDLAVAEQGTALTTQGIAWLAVQRQPDTRVHALLNDGTVRVLIYEPNEEERAWVKVEVAATSAGASTVEDVVVLPGEDEDEVFYSVKMTVNGSTVRRLMQWAREDECWGGTVTKLMDAHVTGTNSWPVAQITGLTHLVGETVCIWADGSDQGTGVVDATGKVTTSATVREWCAGLAYEGWFKSTKLAYGAQMGSPLTQKKRIARLGVLLANTHTRGLRYGRELDNDTMRDLPLSYRGKPTTADSILTSRDDDGFTFPGEWSTDARLCLRAASPRPVTILGLVLTMETRERT